MTEEKKSTGLNRHMLYTYIVKSQISDFIQRDYTYKHILKRLYEIHNIRISEEELVKFINENNIKDYLR